MTPLETEIIKEISAAVEDLSTQHWPKLFVMLEMAENRKLAISFAVEIDRSGKQPKVTTRISFAERHKDERESYIKDPRQGEMSLS